MVKRYTPMLEGYAPYAVRPFMCLSQDGPWVAASDFDAVVEELSKTREALEARKRHVAACGDQIDRLMAERDGLARDVKRLTINSIHTCHDLCERPMCVAQREMDRLTAEVSRLRGLLGDSLTAESQAMGLYDDRVKCDCCGGLTPDAWIVHEEGDRIECLRCWHSENERELRAEIKALRAQIK
jgi:hypothetical protein